MMQVGKNVLWLVKSSGRIMGPYSDRQVSDLLRERLIVPLDEVSRPCDRWIYIRDEPVFAKMVEELRVRNMRGQRDDTTTHATDPDYSTQTASATPMQMDEMTQEIVSVPSPGAVQDILFHSIEEPIRHNAPGRTGDLFTHEGDAFVKKQAHEATRWVWALTALVLSVAVAFVVFRQYVAKPIQNKNIVEQSTTAAMAALDEGDYNKALELFNRAHQLNPADTSIYLYLGILKIQIEDQPRQGRELFEKLRNQEDRDLKRVFTGIGLGYLKESDFKNAELYFNKALQVDPLFVFPMINLGAVALHKQEWAKAANQLQLAIKDGSTDGAETLLLAEALLKLYAADKQKKYLVELDQHLRNLASRAYDYRQEALIILGYTKLLLDDNKKFNPYDAIDYILNLDPYDTDLHKHHIFVARDKTKWNVLSQWCLRFTQDLDPTARVIALESYCLFRAGDWQEANRKIDDALAQAPKDSLVLSTYAYILREMNSIDRAVVMADKAIENDKDNRWVQPLRIRAAICAQNEDYICAKKIWSEVLQRDPKSLSALAGLAQAYQSEQQIKEAKKYLIQGLNLSERYRPFYIINKAISQSEDLQKSRGL